MSYKIEVITSTEEFKNLEKDWKRLEKMSNNQNYNISFDWQFTWWNAFKDRNDKQFGNKKELRIILLYKDDNLIGIAPLVKITRKTRYMINKTSIEFIGQQWAGCFLDFIGKLLRIEIEMFFEWLYKNENFDYVLLSYIPEWTNNFNLNNEDILLFSACPQIYTEQFEDYDSYSEKRYDGNFRRNIRKRTRKLERNFDELSFKIYDGNINNKDIISKVTNISSTKKEDGKHSLYDDHDKKKFMSNLYVKSQINIFTLNINEKPVTYQVCFVYGNIANFLDLAYDRKYRSYSVGTILEDYVINYFFRKKMNINLGTGVSYYKTKFTQETKKIYKYVKPGNSLKSSIIHKSLHNKLFQSSKIFKNDLENTYK